MEYSRQLEAEVQAKACRVPQRIIAPLFASLNHLNTVRDLAVTEDRGQPQAGVKAGEARPANADLSRLDCNDQVKIVVLQEQATFWIPTSSVVCKALLFYSFKNLL